MQAEDWRKTQETGRESLTQAIGRAIFANRGEGLLVPSARVPGGANMAYFPENQRSEPGRGPGSEKLERVRLV